MTDGTPFSSQMSQESCKAKPRVLSSPRLLEEDSPEFPSQQLQATSSGGSESLSNLDLSHGPLVALEYLPFFRTYGQLLAEEELAPQPEAFRDQGGDQSVREEDSELPSGFFPYYRSKEESFPSLALPGRSCAGSRGPSTRREVQACRCCTRTISGDGSVSQGDAEGVWGSTGCPGPRETEGVQGSTGHPGPFKSGTPTPADCCISNRIPPLGPPKLQEKGYLGHSPWSHPKAKATSRSLRFQQPQGPKLFFPNKVKEGKQSRRDGQRENKEREGGRGRKRKKEGRKKREGR